MSAPAPGRPVAPALAREPLAQARERLRGVVAHAREREAREGVHAAEPQHEEVVERADDEVRAEEGEGAAVTDTLVGVRNRSRRMYARDEEEPHEAAEGAALAGEACILRGRHYLVGQQG
jgi:hypothetical protein